MIGLDLFSGARKIILASGLLIALLTSGCLDNNDNLQPAQVSYVNFYHASPDTDELDIVVNSRPINEEPFDFGDYSRYLPFYPGARAIKFTEANSSSVVLDVTLTLVGSKSYSVFIADSLSDIEAVVVEDTAQVPGDGKAMVRLIHLAPDAPAVNLVLDEEALFSTASFKQATAFREVNAGTMDLEFVTDDNESSTLLTVPQVEIEAQAYYTIVLKGFVDPPSGNDNEISSGIIKH